MTANSARLPVPAFVIVGLAVIAMIVWSILQWPHMDATIVTREAAGNHGASTVPRAVTVAAMPLALVLLAVLLAFAPTLDARIMEHSRSRSVAEPAAKERRGSALVLGGLLVGLSVLLPILHVALISLYTPDKVPVVPLVSTAVGVLLIGLGATFPFIRVQAVTGGPREARVLKTQHRAYRYAVSILIVIGAAVIAAAWIVPVAAMPIAVIGTLILFAGIGTASLYPAVRS